MSTKRKAGEDFEGEQSEHIEKKHAVDVDDEPQPVVAEGTTATTEGDAFGDVDDDLPTQTLSEGNPYGDGQLAIYLQMPSAYLGRIIGKGGAGVRTIEEQSGARLNQFRDIPQNHCATKRMKVDGPGRCVQAAVAMLGQALDSAEYEDYLKRAPGAPAVPPVEMTFAIPREFAGIVIGKSGATVEELKQLAGAEINVNSTPASLPGGEAGTYVKVTGRPSQFINVQAFIHLKVAPAVAKQNYTNVLVADPQGTFIKSAGGRGPPAMPGYGGGYGGGGYGAAAAWQNPQVPVPAAYGAPGGAKPPGGYGMPQGGGYGGYAAAYAAQYGGGQAAGYGAYGAAAYGGQGGMPGGAGGAGGAAITSQTYVPDDKVGLCIGRGGATIKELEGASQCRIQVAKQCAPGTFYREITIQGAPQAVEYAKQLISQKVGPAPGQ